MNNIHSRFTPIDDLDSACDVTWLSLCIYGIDPDFVTQKLGIKPSLRQKRGAPSFLPSGKVINGQTNSWIFTSENNVFSKDVRTHLDWLFSIIAPIANQIRELQGIQEVRMSIRCHWSSSEGGGGPTLWPEQMAEMAKLNLECSFSFSDYSEEKK